MRFVLISTKTSLKTLFDAIESVEKEADDIKRKLIAELSSGIFHPIDRETILRLVLSSDDIAAYAKAWSRRTMLMIPLQGRPPDSTATKLVNMGKRFLKLQS